MNRARGRTGLPEPLTVLGSPAPTSSGPVAVPLGAAAGDVTAHEAVIWARAGAPARLVARLTTGAHVGHVLRGPALDETSDLTGRVELTGLSPGRDYDAAVWFEAPDGSRGEVAHLTFRTADVRRRPTSFAWVAGARRSTESWRAVHHANPDLVLDLGPALDPSDTSVQTLADFRSRHRRRLSDEALLALRADVPFVVVWDDHESHRGWLPGALLDDEGYAERRVDLLAAWARRAWQEYQPVRAQDLRHRGDDGFATNRIYRQVARGPLLDLFCLDLRTATGVPLLGAEQTDWLLRETDRSTAVWKVLASDIGPRGVEADAESAAELERLERALHDRGIPGLLWLHPDDLPDGGFGLVEVVADGRLLRSLHGGSGAGVERHEVAPGRAGTLNR